MIKFKLKTKGLEKALESELRSVKLKKMDEIVSDLKAVTPVDTGRARDGWYHNGEAIVNDVEYIDKLNEGHSPQAPEHFVESTILSHGDVIPSGIIVRSK